MTRALHSIGHCADWHQRCLWRASYVTFTRKRSSGRVVKSFFDPAILVMPAQVITPRSAAAAWSFAIGILTQIPVSAQAVESSKPIVPPDFGSMCRYSPAAQWFFSNEKSKALAGEAARKGKA